jgi:type II secretory pathway pseudopilin PulG
MRERLIAYLLSDLDPAERSALETQLAADPQLRQELEKVRQCLSPYDEGSCNEDSCGEGSEAGQAVPPPQLASRTCCFVDHAIQKSKLLCHHSESSKSLSESRDPCMKRSRWSLLDIGVALGILAALAALLFPALRDNRDFARRSHCQNNMRSVGAALMDYSLQFNGALPEIGPQDNAGSFVIALADQGVISRDELVELLVCPNSQLAERVNRGCVRMRVPTRQQYVDAQGAKREFMRQFMAGDYAFSMGYRDAQGHIHQVHFVSSREIPMLADAPSASIAGFQSANHGGCGQNVLFQDLSVRYCKQCKCHKKRDHWFLNDDGQSAAGCHEGDIVLGASGSTPRIELISAK